MINPPEILTLADIHRVVTEPYWNGALASINDHEVRLSVMTETFGWHHHPTSDETFLVLEGRLGIAFAQGEVILTAGQMLTVPRGLVHRTRAVDGRSVNLTFERKDAATIFVDPPQA